MPKQLKPNGRAASSPKARTAAKKPAAKRTASKKKAIPTTFIRNLHGAGGGVRVSLNNGNDIRLEPRGQVGDLVSVHNDDLEDPKYMANVGLLFEEMTPEEAKAVLEKQNFNAQAPRPSVYDHLTNALGQPYAPGSRPIVETPFEQQGKVVAHISDAPDGRNTTGEGQQINRAAAPEIQNVPGSQNNPGPVIPSDVPPEQAADWLARQGLDPAQEERAAADYLGSLRVNVAPTQRGN